MDIQTQLETRGYRRESLSGKDKLPFPFADFCYQKCIKDKIGKKYFINFVHYAASDRLDINETWMVSLDNNNPHFEFRQYEMTNIDQAEKNCEILWQALKCEYYEKFDTTTE